MARKKTILANKTAKNNVFALFDKQILNTPQTKVSGGKWVTYGKKNDFPYRILDMYNSSPTLDACVTFCTSALIGNGLIIDEDVQSVPNYKYDWNEFIRRLATDFFIYGSFAFQVIRNRDGQTYSFYHQPLETVRCSERDSDGIIETWWLSSDWTATGKAGNEPVEIESFIMRSDGEYNLKSGKPYLYVYETYTPQVNYYWLPVWQSAMKSVQSEVEFMNYDLSNATNSFLPAGTLSFPPAADDDEKQAIVEQVRQTFIGSSNSARLMVTFRNDSDDMPVKFEKFQQSNGEFDLFSSSNERAISRILASFNIPSRLLIGYPEQNAGFSSEGALLETAYMVYNTIAGKHYRSIIIGTINNLFRMNGIDVTLEVEDVSFGNVTTTETTEEQPVQQDITEDNIEEQEV